MTHTTEQLQGMSDAEISEAVALKLGMVINNYCGDAVMCGFEGFRSTFADRDYCSNPSDIMPLAFERKIGLAPNKDSWEAFTLADNWQVISNQFVDVNPLRAIACLLLLIGGGE